MKNNENKSVFARLKEAMSALLDNDVVVDEKKQNEFNQILDDIRLEENQIQVIKKNYKAIIAEKSTQTNQNKKKEISKERE